MTVLLTTAVVQAETPRAADGSVPPVRFAEALCPVTGKPVKSEHHTRLRGRRVYCASAAARVAFQNDPYAYQDGLQKQWDVLRPLRIQLNCPVSGKPIRRDVYVERQWDEIFFASQQARTRWLGKPEQFRSRLSGTYSFQTACGTCPNAPKGGVSTKAGQGLVYFCCPGCRSAYESNPGPFLKDVRAAEQANRKAWEQAHAPRGPTSRPRP